MGGEGLVLLRGVNPGKADFELAVLRGQYRYGTAVADADHATCKRGRLCVANEDRQQHDRCKRELLHYFPACAYRWICICMRSMTSHRISCCGARYRDPSVRS